MTTNEITIYVIMEKAKVEGAIWAPIIAAYYEEDADERIRELEEDDKENKYEYRWEEATLY